MAPPSGTAMQRRRSASSCGDPSSTAGTVGLPGAARPTGEGGGARPPRATAAARIGGAAQRVETGARGAVAMLGVVGWHLVEVRARGGSSAGGGGGGGRGGSAASSRSTASSSTSAGGGAAGSRGSAGNGGGGQALATSRGGETATAAPLRGGLVRGIPVAPYSPGDRLPYQPGGGLQVPSRSVSLAGRSAFEFSPAVRLGAIAGYAPPATYRSGFYPLPLYYPVFIAGSFPDPHDVTHFYAPGDGEADDADPCYIEQLEHPVDANQMFVGGRHWVEMLLDDHEAARLNENGTDATEVAYYNAERAALLDANATPLDLSRLPASDLNLTYLHSLCATPSLPPPSPGLTHGQQVGLGVGLGVGLPALLLGGLWIGACVRRAHQPAR